MAYADVTSGLLEPPAADERNWAAVAHLGGLVLGFVPALALYRTKGRRSYYVRREAREALNFQLTLVVAYALALVLVAQWVGFVLLLAVWLGSLVLTIRAARTAKEGRGSRYPVVLRIVR